MKKLPILGLLAVSSIALASCVKKCSFEDFQKAVKEIKAPESEVTLVELEGSIKDKDTETEVDFEVDPRDMAAIMKLSEAEQGVLMVCEMFSVGMFALEEMENTTYYCGDGFKVETEADGAECTFEFNEYGMLTSMEGAYEGAEVDISAEYTFA